MRPKDERVAREGGGGSEGERRTYRSALAQLDAPRPGTCSGRRLRSSRVSLNVFLRARARGGAGESERERLDAQRSNIFSRMRKISLACKSTSSISSVSFCSSSRVGRGERSCGETHHDRDVRGLSSCAARGFCDDDEGESATVRAREQGDEDARWIMTDECARALRCPGSPARGRRQRPSQLLSLWRTRNRHVKRPTHLLRE